MNDDNYEDFGDYDVPDNCCPFHSEGGCAVEDHFTGQAEA